VVSHYSVDAGKHGFLSHAAKLHLGTAERGERRGYGSDVERGSSDSVMSGGNDSLVFTYKPGEDTPPAEYALPASILKVYGDTDLLDDSPIASDRKKFVNVLDDRGRTALSSSSARTSDAAAAAASNITEKLCDLSLRLDAIQLRRLPPLPPASSSLNMIHEASNDGPHLSTIRTAHMIALMVKKEDDNEEEQERILPYHERKRLMKLRAEVKRREKIAAKVSKTNTMLNNDNKAQMLDADERRYLIVDANGYGATNDDNSGNIGTEDVKNNKESTTNCNRKVWFRGLVALVTSRFWRLTGW
jgi:Fe-S cluster biosynthesis and repair protein YggX